jgi:hypothetical protein
MPEGAVQLEALNTNMKTQEPTNRTFINHANVDSNRRDLHRRIALVLRKEPGLVRELLSDCDRNGPWQGPLL